ncbi:hypothetical protein CU633_18425 [Bacillus sp. V3-13]|uniref:imm11 family protein n=1 Tax=Bacillus sp. V3-13 TaxID=2053728 RepID=UPI000C782250|nr:DUF1629 domain-containing protein [Bacillus sp. V3-13]PLR75858.1 hypothetical protein CU633_18425 [Bacillus sp. V3-13]
MRYYRLVYSNDKDDMLPEGKSPIVINNYELLGFDLRALWRGQKINNWNNGIRLFYEKGEVLLDLIPNNLSWLILSVNGLNVVRRFIADAQVFQVSITSEANKDLIIEANVVNVLTSISAMNWEKTDYTAWDDDPKEIKVIRNLVMNRSALIQEPDIFRLNESKNFIIVSERLKSEIEKSNLSGFGFWEIEIT